MKKALVLFFFIPSLSFAARISGGGGSGSGSGDIEGVNAGYGLSGGGTSGTVTIDLETGVTNYIWNSSALQSGATFYVSNGTVDGNFYTSSMTVSQYALFRSVSTTTFENVVSMHFADDALLDLSDVNSSDENEGLYLPQNTNCSGSTGEGQACWDTDDDVLYIGGSDPNAVIMSQNTLQPNTVIFVGSANVQGTLTTIGLNASSATFGNRSGVALVAGSSVGFLVDGHSGRVSIGTNTFNRALVVVSTNANNVNNTSKYPGESWGSFPTGLGMVGYITSWDKPVGVSTGDYSAVSNIQFKGTDGELHEYAEIGVTVVTPGNVAQNTARMNFSLVGGGRSLFDGQSLFSIDPIGTGGMIRVGSGVNSTGTSTEPANGGMYMWSDSTANGAIGAGVQYKPSLTQPYMARSSNDVSLILLGVDEVGSIKLCNQTVVANSTFTPNCRMIVTASGEVLNPDQPSFIAGGVATTNSTGDGTVFTIPYTNEISDVGGHLASSSFTAPVGGMYQLCQQVRVESIGTTHTTVEMILSTSNRNYFHTKSLPGLAAVTTEAIEFCTLADLDENDQAFVTLSVSGTGKTVGTGAGSGTTLRTFWSGTLLN